MPVNLGALMTPKPANLLEWGMTSFLCGNNLAKLTGVMNNVLSLRSSLSIGMRKQFQRDHTRCKQVQSCAPAVL